MAPGGRRCAASRRSATGRPVASRRGPRRRPGPLVRDRVRHFRRPPAPSLEAAEATVIPFGKFHDHTLGQIAAFEPSYIDWVAGTVNHDPDLVHGRPRHPGRARSPRGAPPGASGTRAARPVGLASRSGRIGWPCSRFGPERDDRPPIPEGDHDAYEFVPGDKPPSDKRCRPDGPPGLLAEEPVTRLVNRTRDPRLEPPRADDRVPFRDRRPRYFPVRSRVGV